MTSLETDLKNIVKISQKNYDKLVNGETIHGYTYDPDALYLIKDGVKSSLISIEYNDLVNLRDQNNLAPGCYYRITDYITTVANDDEARSAGHPFDIIVLALSENTLADEGFVIQSDRDNGYFDNINLSAWKIWYCLDNDITRFQWADEDNGKGVIYRMIDEWGNDCPYDFKNIQFKRYYTSGDFFDDYLNNYDWENTCYILGKGMYNNAGMEMDESDFRWVYTFSKVSNPNLNDVFDMSLIYNAGAYNVGAYFNKTCNLNNMKPYYSSALIDDTAYVVQMLNNIVIICMDVANAEMVKCYGNKWGAGCFNMTFLEHVFSNTFGNDCREIVGSKLYSNTFGNYCYSNTFGNSCSNNTFGSDCYSNTFGDYCNHNTFRNNCGDNTFGGDCGNNTFRSSCYSNTFGNGCYSNTFGNHCYSNTFGNHCYTLTIFDGVQYVSVTGGSSDSDYVQNAQILNGTCGDDQQLLTINFVSNANYTQVAGFNSLGELKIWCPADIPDVYNI